MGAQSGQAGGQVYYDNETGQYYTQPGQQGNFYQNNPFLGLNGNNRIRNYLTGLNQNSMVTEMVKRANEAATQTNVPSIEQLFPQLAQSQYLAPAQSTQAQAAPVSYGAGRFMSSK